MRIDVKATETLKKLYDTFWNTIENLSVGVSDFERRNYHIEHGKRFDNKIFDIKKGSICFYNEERNKVYELRNTAKTIGEIAIGSDEKLIEQISKCRVFDNMGELYHMKKEDIKNSGRIDFFRKWHFFPIDHFDGSPVFQNRYVNPIVCMPEDVIASFGISIFYTEEELKKVTSIKIEHITQE